MVFPMMREQVTTFDPQWPHGHTNEAGLPARIIRTCACQEKADAIRSLSPTQDEPAT
jgi:hypothetical protein